MGFGPSLRFLSLAAVLPVFWLLLSGHHDSPYLLTVGLLSLLAVAAFGLVSGFVGRPSRIREMLVSPARVSAVQVPAISLYPPLPILPRMINGGGSTAQTQKRYWQVVSDPG